jgi:Na+/proline symporter
MLKGIRLKPYILHSLVAALVYSLPVVFFLQSADYTSAWLLYTGNFLFLLVIVYFLFVFNAKRAENAGTLAMLTASSITTVMGTVMAVLLSLVLLFVFVPDIFQSGPTEKVLTNEPASSVLDKTQGLAFMIIANAIIGNISCGLFAAIIFPFSLKRDQTKEKVPHRKQAEL